MADERIKQVLAQKSVLLDGGLKQFLPARGSNEYPEINEYYEMLWDYSLRGGKRLRPGLCFLSTQMFGGDERNAIPTGVAMELMHCFLLVHDDIQDGSELRRGKPTLHKQYGIEAAINAGDGLFAKTWETLGANKRLLGATKAFKVFEEFARICAYTVEGQALELAWVRHNKWDVGEKDYYKLVELKTAHYTTTSPLRLGAIIAGAPGKDVNAFDKFGKLFGTGFQIQDDLLNLVGEEGKYGKEIGGDIYEGKRTLALIHVLKKSKGSEREQLESIMNKPRTDKTADDVKLVLEKMREKGSFDYCKQKAKEFAVEAKEYFAKKFAHVPATEGKAGVEALIDFVVERDY